MGKRFRLPNGYGSVYKLSGKRRRPFAVAITVGYDEYGKQIQNIIEYATTREEGLDLLSKYRQNPYDLNYKDLTFEYIWTNNIVSKLEELVKKKKMSEGNLDSLTNAFKNHCIPLHKEKVLNLKKVKMQNVIDNAKNKHNNELLGYTAKGFMITVCKYIFECAIDDYELPIIKNPTEKLSAGENESSNKHIPFTKEEESILWGMQYIDLVKIILIMNYTGNRPNELFKADREKMFIDLDYFVTGSKTEAGKDRPIPIHPKAKHLFLYFYNKGAKYPFQTIFEKFNYSKFSREYTKLMKELGFKHTPYDSRHTFATKMKKAGANEYILKKILGHSIQDLTEKVYTHRDIEELLNEVRRIN